MAELGTFEAARAFDVSPVTLLNLIAQGRLKARKNEYNRWRINRRSLEVWNEKRLARRRKATRVDREVGTTRGVATPTEVQSA